MRVDLKLFAKAVVVICACSLLHSPLVAQAPIPAPIEETAVERIARLKRELLEAELAAAEAAEKSESSESKPTTGEIPVGALVIVEGKEGGGGSGFIAELRDRKFFITNIHVLAAARGASIHTVEGTKVTLPNVAFLSENRDLAIVPIQWSGDYLKVSPSLSFDEVSIGDAITVMGNSDGAGVATRLKGEIDGLGPEELEVSAKFVPGNSGSPIVHDALGTVVGIVSHMRDLSKKDKWTEDSELSDIRRFGFRLDGEINWQRMTLQDLFEQGDLYERFEERTYMLAHTIYMLKSERTVMTGYGTHESLGYLFEPFESGFSWKRGLGSSLNVLKLERFVNGLHNELVTDRKSTEEALKVHYFKQRFVEVDIVRDYYEEQLKHVSF